MIQLKSDEGLASAKRKSKVGDGTKNNTGDIENNSAAKSKRQKRQNGVSS